MAMSHFGQVHLPIFFFRGEGGSTGDLLLTTEVKPVVVLLGCLWVWMWTTLTIEVKPVVVFAGLSVGLDVDNTDH